MTEPTLVKVTLFNPGLLGDDDTPFVGWAGFKPSLQRHIEGETPPDYVVTTHKFYAEFGAPLMDGDTIIQPGEPGVAWAYLEPTTVGPYADAWAWEISFTTPGQVDADCGDPNLYSVPESVNIVDFGDLVQVNPDPPPATWLQMLNAETAARVAGDEDLQNQIDAITAGDVESVNGFTGAVTVELVEEPAGSFFYELQTGGTP